MRSGSHAISSKQQTRRNAQDVPTEYNKSLRADKSEEAHMVGTLHENERRDKVRNYLAKKHSKQSGKKFSYKCRKQVADKRLRIKGRFVTKEQAFEILGLTQNELLDNEMIQQLLTQHADDPMQMNSLIESQKNGGQLIKVRNF